MIKRIDEILSKNPYPGRGIMLGQSVDGCAVIVYFIMGRSENSRNRVFEKTEDGIRTKAFDAAKLADPSLVIYNPVRETDSGIIVTNGDQTDTIRDFLQKGSDFKAALMTREFEPDPPIYTPRISGFVSRDGGYSLSILKTAEGNPDCCCRYFFEYSAPVPGMGNFISTYQTDGNPPPSFAGEPVTVSIDAAGSAADYAQVIWDSLNAENKVALYVRFISRETGKSGERIINRHGGTV